MRFLLFALALSACGREGVLKVEGLTPENKSLVLGAISDLESRVGLNLLQGTTVLLYPSDLGPYAGRLEVGEGGECRVKLNPITLKNPSLLKSVVWHEIGHCLGLSHETNEGEIMSPVAQEFELYSEEAVGRFISQLRGNL